jgi:DNA-binding GntR family transcriptional regulator
LARVSAGTAPLAPPLRRPTLHDEIVVRLRNMILEGVLAPGEALPELRQCEELQISRTPLGEALKVLAAEELVTLLPNRGSVVREIVPDEIEQVFEVMEALEGLIERPAVARTTDAEIAELRAMHEQLVSYRRSDEKHAYFDTNQAIHRRLAAITGNQVLAAGCSGYADKIRLARYLANQTNARWDESVEEHAAFMKALEARDGETFARLLQEHIRKTGVAVVAALHAGAEAPVVPERRHK